MLPFCLAGFEVSVGSEIDAFWSEVVWEPLKWIAKKSIPLLQFSPAA